MSETETEQYAIAFTVNGEETIATPVNSMVEATRALYQLARHHERENVKPDRYRLLRRRIAASEWEEL